MSTSNTLFNEKRENARFEGVYAEYEVFKDLEFGNNSTFKTAFIRNFSKGGVSLYITDDISLHDYVRIRLYDPNSTVPIVLVCHTVWIKKTSFGLKNGQEHYNVGFRITRFESDAGDRLSRLIQHFEALRIKKFNILEHI